MHSTSTNLRKCQFNGIGHKLSASSRKLCTCDETLFVLFFFTKSTLEGPSSRQRAHRCTPAWYPSQLKRPHRKDNPLITFEKETYEYRILQYQAMSEAAGLIADHLSIAWRRAAQPIMLQGGRSRWLLDAAWMAIWGGLHSKVYKGVPPCAACMSTSNATAANE